MNQRERFLAMGVGGLLLVIIAQWGFSKYRTAVRTRMNRIASMQNEKQVLQERLIAGAYADRQMGEYLIRSLPSDAETARSVYQSWLLSMVREQGLADAKVDPVSEIADGDLYRRYGYHVTGRTDLAGLVNLLHAIAARDTLHRVRELVFAPARTGDLNVDLSIDAISLSDAPPTAMPTSAQPSWRIATPIAEVRETILNRNFFQPANQPPQLSGSNQLVAIRGQSTTVSLPFEDPEKSKLTFAIEGELPEWAKFDPSSGRVTFTAPEGFQSPQPITFTVDVSDQGRPPRQTSQSFSVALKDAPPPVAPPEPPPGFDDATQTYVSALLDGAEPMVWMKVRTRGETLKLRIGDEFKIGSVSGKVIGMTSRAVQLEIDGQQYDLRPAVKLSEATKATPKE